MDKEIKAKWVEALRSGKYKQGRLALRPTEDSFCCLGVLCDILGEKWIAPHEDGNAEDHFSDAEGGTELLSRYVMKKVGLADDNPLLQFGDTLATLSLLNDGSGSIGPITFSEIADLIEAQL